METPLSQIAKKKRFLFKQGGDPYKPNSQKKKTIFFGLKGSPLGRLFFKNDTTLIFSSESWDVEFFKSGKGGPADALFLVEILEIFENFRSYYIHSE